MVCLISGRTEVGRDRRRRPTPTASGERRGRACRRRLVPRQHRHAHALELAHEGVPVNVIQSRWDIAISA
jgi:hypothetical protein